MHYHFNVYLDFHAVHEVALIPEPEKQSGPLHTYVAGMLQR